MKLSYSDYKNYLECPKKYYFISNHVKPPEEPSKYFALYGMLIESFFKLYTNVYLKNNISLDNSKIKDILSKEWDRILMNNYVDWNKPWVKENATDIFRNVYQDTLENIEKIGFWKNANSEVTLSVYLKKSGDLFTGRLDFIVRNPDNTVEIIDGKGSSKIGENVEFEQLYFYILLYYLHYKELPKKAGFLYYKYKNISYIDFDAKTISDFKNKLLLTRDLIKKDKTFLPIVNLYKQCKWCPYKEICDDYIKVRTETTLKNNKIQIHTNLFINESSSQE